MSIGVLAARVRLLDIRQPFRLEANRLLAPDEWPELAIYRFYLPQTEPADHLIVAVPCIRPVEHARPAPISSAIPARLAD